MNAIAGKVTFGREQPSPRDVVIAMTNALAHRGPDGCGFHFAAGIGLGHRQLQISDESPDHQPVGNERDTVWAALDGEITNAAVLRTDLEGRGHTFRTTTDAEVLVHGYEQWGEQVIERLRGPFACVVWDESRRRLLLGRDRLGIRPLHYAVIEGHGVVFASEIKALLEDPDVPADWDAAAVKEYLTLGYVPSPATVFSRIVKLPAGHVLVAEHGRVRVSSYWVLSFGGDGRRRPEADYVEHLDDLLGKAVRGRAGAGAPVTVLLASGVASATIAGYLGRDAASPVVTTTTAFDEPPFDEVNRARAVAKHLGARHYTELVTPDIPELLPQLAWHFDEPFADPAVVTTYYSAVGARAHGPFVITAAGSDEIWAGHARHRFEQMEARARRWLGPLRYPASVIAPLLPMPMEFVRSARRLSASPAEAYASKHVRLRRATAGDRLFTAEFADYTAGVDPLATLRAMHDRCASRDEVDRALYVDVKTSLADNVLTRMDRVSAAASVVMRLPMLDQELVEFAATVPSFVKVRAGATHHLLRRVAERRAPATLLQRSRHPFEADAARWLRGPLASMASDLLLSGRFRQRGIFDARRVTRAWQAHLTGGQDYHQELWALLMLELWFERLVDRPAQRQRAA